MNRIWMFLLVFLQVELFAAATPILTTDHRRVNSYSFTNGNLLRNWSFEAELDGWYLPNNLQNSSVYFHQSGVSTGSDVQAISGTHLAKLVYQPGLSEGLHSDTLPIEAGKKYTLSFWYYASNLARELPVRMN